MYVYSTYPQGPYSIPQLDVMGFEVSLLHGKLSLSSTELCVILLLQSPVGILMKKKDESTCECKAHTCEIHSFNIILTT